MTNKVYLVGAGTGDPELLTLKGLRLLKSADVVVYDRLVNQILLYLTKEEAQLVYVGKAPNAHAKSQSEIEDLLVNFAKNNKSVVRLKGGDPAIFGRVGEEMARLRAENIPYEVVPAVTAASSVSSYADIAITQRGIAERVLIMTPHETLADFADLDLVATLTATTLVLYMAVGNLPAILQALSSQAVPETMPIAVIENGTLPSQRTILSNLGDLSANLVQKAPKNPALIVIGHAVKFGSDNSWFQQLPKFGKRILLVRRQLPKFEEIIKFTSQGADIWLTLVGEKRQNRFANLDKVRLTQNFDEIVFRDGTSQADLDALI
ncbi:hypothetical protein Hs30E_02870 [Lactococcus hodotermopsidis]|uniref:uroporphyrinogen-III C-methyltransferase n=1 Tax=Pseudolactococcus hodotermopsidis TaxID=2709157 RepID=A0A6A0BAB9_9LACT|nr:uroporphyrinogen-III C-methyltransferase [Lactococcus hodotermopsidis]GFH41736.1 hypothetical protein Hs30E_02870 [Lactococcus hodotermopsidis]